MLKPKTHFEQVPLEVVKKIAEKESSRKKRPSRPKEPRRKVGRKTSKAQVRPEKEVETYVFSVRYFPGRDRRQRALA
jgi:hypothetical protein